MNKLWAPWRKAYIRPKKKKKGCLFCRINQSKSDAKNKVICRSEHCFAVLNLYPYNNGHVMIVPNRHIPELSFMTSSERLDWLNLTEHVIEAIRSEMNPHGFNLGINMEAVAGAGIPGHLHLHIVPRWLGDHNFMPVISSTKVISESLESSYDILSKRLFKAADERRKRC